jgi:hypothetical protein
LSYQGGITYIFGITDQPGIRTGKDLLPSEAVGRNDKKIPGICVWLSCYCYGNEQGETTEYEFHFIGFYKNKIRI